MPRALRLDDQLQHDRRLMHAQRRGRLVEDQHLGAEIDGAGDRQALALAARQRADRLLGIAQLDAHLAQLVGMPCALRSRCRAGCTEPTRFSGSRPRKKLRATLISGTSARSW